MRKHELPEEKMTYRHKKINRCVKRPTHRQLDDAYQACWDWVKQHETFLEPVHDNARWGVLSLLYIEFVTSKLRDFFMYEDDSKVFTIWKGLGAGWTGVLILDAQGEELKLAKRLFGYKRVKIITRKYYRWVRRNF